MWKLFLAILVALFVLSLSSCFMEYTFFEHQLTKKLIKNINKGSFQNFKEFCDDGILFVPFFEKLTNSFAFPESFLMLYSLEKDRTVFISSATIRGMKTGYNVTLEIKKTLYLDGKAKNDDIRYTTLPLFTAKNTDMNVISKEEEVEVIIYYSFFENTNDSKHITFNLVRRKGTDIAWPT